jgi:hypothetical protein
MTRLDKRLINAAVAVTVLAAIAGAYRWSNTPPKHPKGVSTDAVFLWAGHLGLPAPKHGTWIECWTDVTNDVNKCRLTEMNGTRAYEGVFVADRGGMVPQSKLKIESEPTSDATYWVRFDAMRGAPLVYLRSGVVLIPKDGYREGLATLEHLRQVREK